jgi:hypothetical protein
MKSIFAAIFLMTLNAQAQVQKNVEINLYVLGQQRSSPEGLNGYITEVNNSASTTRKLDEISGATSLAAEVAYITDSDIGIGLRYSLMAGATSSGVQSGQNVSLAEVADDVSLVLKIMTSPEKWQWGLGVTAGMTSHVGVSLKQGETINDYLGASQFVGRGFGSGRINFGRFALFGELGYMYLKASELKYKNVTLKRADGTPVELNLSGGYLLLGFGFQF